MKFSLKSLVLIVLTSVVFTSCFEFKELIHFNKDGSGDFEFQIDMSSMKMLIEMAQEMDSTQSTENPMAGAVESMDQLVEQFAVIDGISNASSVVDEENYKFGFKFSFSEVDVLNDAMNKLYQSDNPFEDDRVFFKMKGKNLVRVDAMDFKSLMGDAMGSAGDEADMDLNMFMQDAKYVTVYSFDRKVKKCSNDNATISGNTVTLEQLLFKEGNEEKLDNVIKLK